MTAPAVPPLRAFESKSAVAARMVAAPLREPPVLPMLLRGGERPAARFGRGIPLLLLLLARVLMVSD